MTKKKDVTIKPDVISVSAKAQEEPKREPELTIKEILKPFISDRMNQLTGQLPDETPFRLEAAAPAPKGYSVVITLRDWRQLYRFAKGL